ncbi:MAG: hypothetical protein Ct9H300mP19_20610 [Dehalococcoidia bacterium]|nr:MAG: hypothetical protein Ct9H300mP19_20610 [Dehalococcoidia bacterium]
MQNLKGPRRALVGPWTHVYPHFGFPGPAIGFLKIPYVGGIGGSNRMKMG